MASRLQTEDWLLQCLHLFTLKRFYVCCQHLPAQLIFPPLSCPYSNTLVKADLVGVAACAELLLDQEFAARFPPCPCDMADSGTSGEFSASLTSSTLPPPRTRIFKMIVIGDSGVGKTCLTYRFCAGKFPEKTEATIGVDFRERLVDIDGEKIKVCILQNTLSKTWLKPTLLCISHVTIFREHLFLKTKGKIKRIIRLHKSWARIGCKRF